MYSLVVVQTETKMGGTTECRLATKLTLLTTNDLHSQVTGAGGLDRYPSTLSGHYARIVKYLRSERAKLEDEGTRMTTTMAFCGACFKNSPTFLGHQNVNLELQCAVF